MSMIDKTTTPALRCASDSWPAGEGSLPRDLDTDQWTTGSAKLTAGSSSVG